MGWCSGSMIANKIYNKIRKYLPKEVRLQVAYEMYEIFSENDADCWSDDMPIYQDWLEYKRQKRKEKK